MTNHHHPDDRRRPHKDWRVWAGVILILAAIAIYVLTLDDSLLR
jgi:hypothetical protein